MAHNSQVWSIGPEEDWCAFVNGLEFGGDVVRLAPGDYPGPCVLIGKVPSEGVEITQIISADSSNPARVVWDGSSDFVVTLEGQRIALLNLLFEDMPSGVDVVRAITGPGIWVGYNTFRNIAGRAVVAEWGDTDEMLVFDNTFDNVATPMVLGCDANDCRHRGVGVLNNRVVGGATSLVWTGATGGRVYDNVFDGVEKAVFGDSSLGGDFTGNLVDATGVGARWTGPGEVSNNIVVSDSTGFRIVGGRLDGGTQVLGNTVVAPRPFLLENWQSTDGFAFRSNAVGGPVTPEMGAPTPTLPEVPEGVPSDANVLCEDPATCWGDVQGWDFAPTAASPLRGGTPEGLLTEDFCFQLRRPVSAVGAVMANDDGPLPRGVFKKEMPCTFAQFRGDTAEETDLPADTDDPDVATDNTDGAGTCGCATSTPIGGWLLLGGLAAIRRCRS